jgi:hypothetical protein
MFKRLSLPLAAAAALALSTGAAAGDGHQSRSLRTRLSARNEVPIVVSGAQGSFRATFSDDGQSFDYELDYSALEGTVTQSHIHIGQRFASGGISVWLCKTGLVTVPATVPADTPECKAPGDGPEAAGTISAEDVVGPTGQAVPIGAYADLVWALRTGNAYVNVHSTAAPGGEVRGQIGPGGHSHHGH